MNNKTCRRRRRSTRAKDGTWRAMGVGRRRNDGSKKQKQFQLNRNTAKTKNRGAFIFNCTPFFFFLSFFLFFNSLKDSDYLFNFPLSIFCCCCCSPFWFYTAGWILNCTGKKNPIAKRFVSLHRYDYNRRRRKIVVTYTRFLYIWISRLYSSAEAATVFFFIFPAHI